MDQALRLAGDCVVLARVAFLERPGSGVPEIVFDR